MVEIIPHINTLIVDFGTEFTKIGYSGDFHPTFTFKTPKNIDNNICDTFCKLLEKYLKDLSCDSLIFIENTHVHPENKIKILRFLFSNKFCNSILFLSSLLADIFGFGKISGTIISCSASKFQTATIINGKIIENNSYNNGSLLLEDKLLANVDSSILSNQSNIVSTILESTDICDMLKNDHNIDIFDYIKDDIIKMVDEIANSRFKHYINKKNASNGCIILSGGLFKYDIFYNYVKSIILEKIGADFSDFILRDKDLNSTFVGAAIFGMNNQTKPMFITSYDWQNIGSEILKLKAF